MPSGRRRPHTRTRAQSERIHFRRRALERYGLRLGDAAQDRIVEDIRAGRAVFVERQSHRVRIYDVQYAGQRMRVVYDRKRRLLVSALPEPKP